MVALPAKPPGREKGSPVAAGRGGVLMDCWACRGTPPGPASAVELAAEYLALAAEHAPPDLQGLTVKVRRLRQHALLHEHGGKVVGRLQRVGVLCA